MTLRSTLTLKDSAQVARDLARLEADFDYLLAIADGYPLEVRVGDRTFVFTTEDDLRRLILALKSAGTGATPVARSARVAHV